MQKTLLLTALLALGCDDGADNADPLHDAGHADAHLDHGDAFTADEDLGTTEDAGAPDAATDDAATPPPIEWVECDLLSDPGPNSVGRQAECAWVDVPLDWDAPDGDTVEIWVKRNKASFGSQGQLWLLQGGPGGSSVVFERNMRDFANRFIGFDIYITDARGAGFSSRWSCPEGESPQSPSGFALEAGEVAPCLAELQTLWGPDGLDHFNTTAAAKDVLHLIERTAEPERSVFVFGVSYGTYWVNRILQLAPERLAGAILDSVVDAEAPNLSAIDTHNDPVGQKLMAACAEDVACGERLGEDPWAAAVALLDDIDAGHCADLFGGDGRQILRQLMGVAVSDTVIRSTLPALVYRIRRCEPRDIEAVAHLAGLLFGSADSEPPLSSRLFSRMLSMHVTFSELWGEAPLDAEGLAAQAETLVMSKDIGVAFGPHFEAWPRYEVDAFHGQWAQTDTPVLMMNGTWDPLTPIESALNAAQALDGAHQTFVTVPWSGHSVLSSSQVTDGGPTCGVQLLGQFLYDPQAPLDTGCLDTLQAPFFELPARYAQLLFGTDSYWD